MEQRPRARTRAAQPRLNTHAPLETAGVPRLLYRAQEIRRGSMLTNSRRQASRGFVLFPPSLVVPAGVNDRVPGRTKASGQSPL